MEKAIQPAQNPLFERIASVIDAARQRELRADYGKEILKNLSARLTERYGAG